MTAPKIEGRQPDMSEFDSVAAALELRDSVPADQPHLWRFMDIIVKNFERSP